MRRFALVFVLGALLAAPAQAAAKPHLHLSRTAAQAGERVAVVGHDFASRARVRIRIGGTIVRRGRTGPRGGFRLRIEVPAKAAGRYRLAVRAGGRLRARRFRVRAPKPRAPLTQPAPEPAPPAPAPPAPPPAEPPTLVAAGDIACRPALAETDATCRHARTAALAEALAPHAVAVLGDNQYQHGTLDEFMASYHPTWGRLKQITRPAAGNHEYEGDPERDSADGYYTYFGAAAGDPAEGYYRWSLGGWTIFALNSGAVDYTRAGGLAPELDDDCWPVSCEAGSRQEAWLRAELETLPADACVLAYWHHPRYSSGFNGVLRDYPETAPLYDALHDHGAELVLSGHAHNYERFHAMDAAGALDAATGVTQFVVGTGGRDLHENPAARTDGGSAQIYVDAFGVLELTLAPGGWSSRFITESGELRDQASGSCHGPPAP